MASKALDKQISLYHHGAPFPTGEFSESKLRGSKYFDHKVIGVGGVLSRTHYNDSASYQTAGAGIAYRNIIGNKVYLKGGLLYKVVQVEGHAASFEPYEVIAQETALTSEVQQNLNYSFSVSSASDFFFLSYSRLNQSLPWDETTYENQFPTYQILQVGNLRRLWQGGNNGRLVLSAVHRKLENITDSWSYYLVHQGHLAHLNRTSSLMFGARVGYADASYYHFTPSLMYYQTWGRRNDYRYLLIRLAVDYGFEQDTYHQQFKPVTQLSLITQF